MRYGRKSVKLRPLATIISAVNRSYSLLSPQRMHRIQWLFFVWTHIPGIAILEKISNFKRPVSVTVLKNSFLGVFEQFRGYNLTVEANFEKLRNHALENFVSFRTKTIHENRQRHGCAKPDLRFSLLLRRARVDETIGKSLSRCIGMARETKNLTRTGWEPVTYSWNDWLWHDKLAIWMTPVINCY